MSETPEQTLSDSQVAALGKAVAQRIMLSDFLRGVAFGVARDAGIAPDLNTKDQWEVAKAAIRELADQINYSPKES